MTMNKSSLTFAHKESFSESCGWVFVGPDTTLSGKCKGIYFSIHPKDSLGKALIAKGVKHVQISIPSNNLNAVELRATFKNHSPRSFRLIQSVDDLTVKFGTRDVPENLARILKIYGYLDIRGELSDTGVLTVELPN